MQIHISHIHKGQTSVLGEPLLLYAGKLEKQELLHPRSMHTHPNAVEFIYILQGHGEYEIANQRWAVAQGDLVVYDHDVVHYEFVDNQKLPILFCAATGIQRPNMEPNCVLRDSAKPVFHLGKEQQLIAQLMQKIFDTALLGKQNAAEVCQSLFLSFLYLVTEIVDQNRPIQSERNDTVNRLGQDIRAYVDSQPIQSISVPQVAENFKISESYLARVFKKSFGCSLVEYMMRRKIGEAQTLLLMTDLSIMEIGQCIGYQNQSYFAKMFAEHVGLSPLRYRKMYQKQKTYTKSVL